jgi:hypothetical protein
MTLAGKHKAMLPPFPPPKTPTTRRLLADLVGGEAGRNLRDQFA